MAEGDRDSLRIDLGAFPELVTENKAMHCSWPRQAPRGPCGLRRDHGRTLYEFGGMRYALDTTTRRNAKPVHAALGGSRLPVPRGNQGARRLVAEQQTRREDLAIGTGGVEGTFRNLVGTRLDGLGACSRTTRSAFVFTNMGRRIRNPSHLDAAGRPGPSPTPQRAIPPTLVASAARSATG